jgi:hypothetical protein
MSLSFDFASVSCGLLLRLELPVCLALKWFILVCLCSILPFEVTLKRFNADFEVLSLSFGIPHITYA